MAELKYPHRCEKLYCPVTRQRICCNFCGKEYCLDTCRNHHEKCGLYYGVHDKPSHRAKPE